MYKGYKIVCVTPAGRARYMKILLPYILSSPYVDEYHIWVNTPNPEDVKFLRICNERFRKVKLIHLEGETPKGVDTICKFFKTAIVSDTIYIRFDDDIVFIEEGFFERFFHWW